MGQDKRVVLVISAGEFPRPAITELIGYCDCETVWLGPGVEWPAKLRRLEPDVVLGDEDARYLRPVMQRNPDVPLVLAVQAGRGRTPVIQSVFRRVLKPVSPAQLVLAIERALVYRKIAVDCWTSGTFELSELLGNSECMRGLYRALDDVGAREDHILITGERGTGKRRLAQAIHRRSARSARPIHFADCRSVREHTYQSQVFGPLLEQPADTDRRLQGRTLVLGEVGTLSRSIQSALLTVLRERRIRLADDAGEIDCDLRVIATTGDPLEVLAEDGRFLPELLDLFAERLTIPPLRQRKEDITFLIWRVMRRIAAEPGVRAPQVPSATEVLMLTYNWPGNARELRFVLARAALTSESVVSPKDIDLPQPTDEVARREALKMIADRAQAKLAEEVFELRRRESARGNERASKLG